MKNIVETKKGKVQGMQQDGLIVFKGIPFAAPPVGDKRWMPPEPAPPWTGVLEAISFGPISSQPAGMAIPGMAMPPEWEIVLNAWGANTPSPQSEDCLYLNIWSPELDNARRPVMFWIHGGGFSQGSGSGKIFHGDVLSKRGDVVVVSINYRLGALGFLNLNEITGGKITATGNEGLLDQVAGLEWVRDNITLFGGDPDNVTIFGESAGGMSVGCLLGLPRAKGLFHKAIPQSGASNTGLSLETGGKISQLFVEALGLEPTDTKGLCSVSKEQILNAQIQVMMRTFIPGSDINVSMSTQPIIDGTILPAMPISEVRDGSADGVPVMVGACRDEWNLFSLLDPGVAIMDETSLLQRFEGKIPDDGVQALVKAYQDGAKKREAQISFGDIFNAIQTDKMFGQPAIRLAEVCRDRKQPVYSYLFTWESPLSDGRLGACHSLEQGFVFGKLEDGFSGTGPEAQALAEKMQDAWIAFARTGNPSCDALDPWPTYGEKRETMLLGETCTVTEDPNSGVRQVWNDISDAAIGSI
jgi:para-nitrobenzyl esterase